MLRYIVASASNDFVSSSLIGALSTILAMPCALFSSSSWAGGHRVTIIPRFILAGSRAQLEIPIKATLSSGAISISSGLVPAVPSSR